MRRWQSLTLSAAFLAIAPGVVAGVTPWWLTGWRFAPPLLAWSGAPWLGGGLIAAGAGALLECFVRFAWRGRGTPAPVAPTADLVVSGLYRFTRNPMYLAVIALVVGQALLFGATILLVYAAALTAGFHLFVIGYEEPSLRRRFPQAYSDYMRRTPRWLGWRAPRERAERRERR